MADTTTTKDTNNTAGTPGSFTVKTNGSDPLYLKPAYGMAKDASQTVDRRSDKGMISGAGGSVSVKDGQISLAANDNAQLKLTQDGTIKEQAFQKVTKVNRDNLEVDEIIINHHVLNNKLYDLTDFKQVTTGESLVGNGIVGNFCVTGSVLVKAWEPELKRYVFIRRPVRMPMFSPAIKPPEMMSGMDLTDDTQAKSDLQTIMEVKTKKGTMEGQNTSTSNKKDSKDSKTDNKDSSPSSSTSGSDKKE